MQAFVEERLDLGIDYGADGGPEFSTDVVELSSGHEHRDARWANGRGRWELGQRTIDRAEKDALLAFFRARRGQAVGFRYKDWNDYRADGEALAPDGTPTVQLRKTYESATAGEGEVRTIRKPVAGTVTLERQGSAYTPASIDDTTGVVTLQPDVAPSITDVTAAAPAVVTAAGHGLATGETVYVTGTGLATIDDRAWVATVIDADTLSLDGSDTSGTGGASSGTVARYVQPGEALSWSGEFDTPARFETDQFRANFDAFDPDIGDGHWVLASLPVVEIRV